MNCEGTGDHLINQVGFEFNPVQANNKIKYYNITILHSNYTLLRNQFLDKCVPNNI